MSRFLLYINYNNKIVERALPAENDRKLILDISDIIDGCSIPIEFFDNVWTFIADNGMTMKLKESNVNEHIISNGDVIRFKTLRGHKFVVTVYEINHNTTGFVKYSISGRNRVTIGKNSSNDISVNSNYISSEHTRMELIGENWYIIDTSTNGTFVNGHKYWHDMS